MSKIYAVELNQVVKKFGSVTAVNNVDLQIEDGEFFSLLGPSGCGKTTSLRMIAGFEMPTSGTVSIHGEMQGHLPAFKRPVNTVFQHYALFPHMTVWQNVAFGLEMQKVDTAEIKIRVAEALELVHLDGLGKRRPKQLSGGQQQRVALARALVNHPKVLLLDEPLGALDLKLRRAMQVELKELQERVGITFIYVTHDQEEALTMSDRIGVMDQGMLLQIGSAREIYENPKTRFVSDFIGETNYIPVKILNNQAGEFTEVITENGKKMLTLRRKELTQTEEILLAVRPEKVQILSGEKLEVPNAINARIETLVYTGSSTSYICRLEDDTEIVTRMQNEHRTSPDFQEGALVTLSWQYEDCRLFRAPKVNS